MINAYAAKEAGGKLEKFQYDPGKLGSHDVEIDVESCGICHSDLSMGHDRISLCAWSRGCRHN